MLILSAPAKLNLYLHVTGKRDDGYHLLDSLVVFTDDLADKLTFQSSDKFKFTCDGPFSKKVDLKDNLVVKAKEALAKHFDRPANVHIHLEKNIPVAAGLGGGSADAATTLRGLMEFWEESIDEEALSKIALSLGADVPICLKGESAQIRGVGEKITPVYCPSLKLLLLQPKAELLTEGVFGSFKEPFKSEWPYPLAFPTAPDLIEFLTRQSNQLYEAANQMNTDVGKAISDLKDQENCIIARMSGSGATCFGIFNDEADLKNAEKTLSKAHPDWWVMSVQT